MRHWYEFFNACKAYKDERGNLKDIPYRCVINGCKLGKVAYEVKKGILNVTADEVAMLDSIGFDWNCKNYKSFEEIFKLFEEYVDKHGNLDIKPGYTTEDGTNLYLLASRIRSGIKKTTPEQKERLEAIGFKFKEKREYKKAEKSVCYVFDTSIASEIDAWNKLFDDIIQRGEKIILTSIVLSELDSMQMHRPENMGSLGARRILARIAEDDDNFIIEKIGESHKLSNDEAIIKYCIDRNNAILITADKVMALKARMEKIKTIFVSKTTEKDIPAN